MKQTTRAILQTVKKKELCFNSIASPRPGYHLVFLTYLLNFHLSSVGFKDCQALVLEREARVQNGNVNRTQPELCQFTDFYLSHDNMSHLNMSVTWLSVVNFWKVLGAMSTDKRGLGLNFMSIFNILF